MRRATTEQVLDEWRNGDAYAAGAKLCRSVPADRQPVWARRLMAACCGGTCDIPPVQRLLTIAADPVRWHEARTVFQQLRTQRMMVNDGRTRLLLELAEEAAEVIYNATGPPDPFDADSGADLAMAVRRYVDDADDGDLVAQVEQAFADAMAEAARRR
jgi:hypothetical protein